MRDAAHIRKDKLSIIQTDFQILVLPIDHKFSDRYVWANITDPDLTSPRGAV